MPYLSKKRVRTQQPQTASSIKPYWLGRGLYSVNIWGLGNILSQPQPLPADSTITNSSVGKLVSQATPGASSSGLYLPKRLLTERTDVFLQVCTSRRGYGRWLAFGSDAWAGEYSDVELTWTIHGAGWNTQALVFAGNSPISLVGAPVCIAGVWGSSINGGAGRAFVNGIEVGGGGHAYTDACDRTLSSAFAEGGPNQQVSGIALHYAFSEALSTTEIKDLSRNPWQLFKKQDRRIWIPSAGGGDVTIACTPGNATPAGVTAGVSSATTLSCNVGGATTAGITAGISAATTIACNVGNATTAGISAGITQAIVITCNAGTATTAGVSASISLDTSITITCNAGNATTAGISAVFPQMISCTPGNATTAGVTAGIAGATVISCNVGNASVAGISAGISSAITISCNVGTATTAGVSATFPQSLSCNVGNATTAGITAQVDIAGQIVIGCNAGTATTAGVSANISSAFVLSCNVGNATTIGATAYFPQSLQCSPGNAIALGIDATVTLTGPTTIVCNAGNATASGISFSFGGTLVDAPNGSGPSIIRPQTIRPLNVGGIRI